MMKDRMVTDSNKSRRRFIQTAGAAGVIGLAGCSGNNQQQTDQGTQSGDGGTTSKESTELRMISVNNSQGWQDHYDKVAKEYEKQTNNKLKVQIVGVDQGLQSVAKELRAGNPPALVHDQAWGTPGNFIAKGLTVPVDDITSDINGWDEVMDQLKFTYDGNVMNIPTDVILNMFAVRKDLVEQAGIDLEPYLKKPWKVSFDEYNSWSKKVDEDPNIKARGSAFSLATSGAAAFTGPLKWFWGNGVSMWKGTQDDPKIVFDQGENVDKAKTALQAIKENYQYSPTTVGWGYSEYLTNMGNGNVAMGGTLDAAIVAFTTATDKVKKNLVGVGNPLGPDYQQWNLRNWTSGNSLIPFDTKNSDAALDFIVWYMNSDVGKTRYSARPIHNAPVRVSEYSSEEFTSIPYVKDHPEMVAYYKHALENSTHQPYSYSEDKLEWIPGLSSAYSDGVLGQMTYKYLEDGKSAEEAISWGADKVRSYLE